MLILNLWRAPVGKSPLRTWASVLLLLAVLRPYLGNLTVTVLNDAASNAPAAGAVVTVLETGLSAITNSSGVALIRSLRPGTYTVVTRLAGLCQASHTVTVPEGATAVTLYLCTATPPQQQQVTPPPSPTPPVDPTPTDPTPPSSGSDQITISNPPTGTPLLLFDAETAGSTCIADRMVANASPIPLGLNALPPTTTGCLSTVALFTPDHGFFFSNKAATLPWTAVNDNVTVTLPPLLRVPVTVWVASAGSGSMTTLINQIRTAHLAKATAILREAGAGLELVADLTTGGDPQINDVSTDASARAAIGSNCDNVDEIRATPAIYRPTHLNVYYVANVPAMGVNRTGFNCTLEDAPEIMFIDADESFLHILAHELGHALGLLEPNWGHTTDYLGGFILGPNPNTGPSAPPLIPRNFMAYGAADAGGIPIYASRGQALRMNISDLSWLNRQGLDGMTPRQRATGTSEPVSTCPCPAAEASQDCPQLPLTDLSATNLTTAAPLQLACEVQLSQNSVDVCQDKNVEVKATFHATIAGVPTDAIAPEGKTFWVNQNPELVVVTEANSGPGWSLGKITGAAVGTAEVRVVAGGPKATLTVRVKTCP